MSGHRTSARAPKQPETFSSCTRASPLWTFLTLIGLKIYVVARFSSIRYTFSSQTRCKSWMIASFRSCASAPLSSIQSCSRNTSLDAATLCTQAWWRTKKISRWSRLRLWWWRGSRGRCFSRVIRAQVSSWRMSLEAWPDPTVMSNYTILTSRLGSIYSTWTRSNLICTLCISTMQAWSSSHSFASRFSSGRKTKDALITSTALSMRCL